LTRFRKNFTANALGQVVNGALGFAVIPIYQKLLGLEGYGLVAFFLSVQAMMALLDFGLATTANREFSRLQGRGEKAGMGHTLRTLEVVYFSVAGAIFLVMACVSGFVGTHWLQARDLPRELIQQSFLLAIATLAMRWPISLYIGVLRGLEQHVRLNLSVTTLNFLRMVGGVAVLSFSSPTVVAFYQWQFVFGIVETVWLGLAAWRWIGWTSLWASRFDRPILRGLWQFALNVGWISVFAVILKNLDKLLISRMLPLEHLAYYSTASMAGTGITLLGQPLQTAAFPAMAKLVAREDAPGLAERFHRAACFNAFLVAPAACLLIFFPEDILFWWTRSELVAARGGVALRWIAAAMLLNSMMGVLFVLQMAQGMTWLPLVNNAIALGVLGPLIYFLVATYGISGGAFAWLIYNLLYYLVLPHFVFRHVLPGHKRTWYLRDTLPFLVAGVVAFGVARGWAGTSAGLLGKVVAMTAAGTLYVAASVAWSPMVRGWIFRAIYPKGSTASTMHSADL
jgi:O-antigen/teichoic acid export membrane protein